MNIQSNATSIAKKYAQAFLHMYKEKLVYDDIKDIEHSGKRIQDHAGICLLFKYAAYHRINDTHTLSNALKELHVVHSLTPLITLLLKTQRLHILQEICFWIGFYFRKMNRIVQFWVTSAQPLTFEQKKIVEQFLTSSTRSVVEVTYGLDHALIAGLRMQSDTYIWEKSIAQQLRDVRLKSLQ